MLNQILDIELDETFNLIPPLDGNFSYVEISNLNLKTYIKKYIQAELYWRILDSFLVLNECKNYCSHLEFTEQFKKYFDFTKNDLILDHNELREILISAINFRINAFIQPFNLLTSLLFTNNILCSKYELFIKKEYLENDNPTYLIFEELINQNNKEYISKIDFNKFLNNYKTTIITDENLFNKLFELVFNYFENYNIKLDENILKLILNDVVLKSNQIDVYQLNYENFNLNELKNLIFIQYDYNIISDNKRENSISIGNLELENNKFNEEIEETNKNLDLENQSNLDNKNILESNLEKKYSDNNFPDEIRSENKSLIISQHIKELLTLLK